MRWSLSLSLLVGCSGGGSTDPLVPKETTSTDGFPPLGAELVVTDAHLHTFEADWVIPSSPIRADLDATLDWSGVTTDAYGEARDPMGFDAALLFYSSVSRTELTRLLAVDQLETAVDASWTGPVAGETETYLGALTGAEGPFDPAVWLTEGATLLFALGDRDGDRLDIRTGVILEPTPDSGAVLQVPGSATRMTWLGKLDGDILRTQVGHDDYPLDWSAITTDGYGQPYDPSRADELFLGRFDAGEADDLARWLLDLEANATDWWTMPLDGETAVGLSALVGGPLEEGVYLVGARCTTCLGPAPLWSAGLEVRGD